MSEQERSHIQKPAELTKLAENVAVKLEYLVDELPDDGNIDMEMRIKNGASILGDIASACGVLDIHEAYYKLSRVRGELFEIKAMVKLAHRLRDIRIQPELMLEIEALITSIDEESVHIAKKKDQGRVI